MATSRRKTIAGAAGALPGLGDGIVDIAGLARSVFEDWIVDHSSIEGLDEDYDFENVKVTHATMDHGLPLTFWRSVGHSYTAFAKRAR
ncbi:MAG: hypothetical protein U5O39_12865 [Gammaproteobacteria bacterium]|nr:hypothetical protein [Gammaproteobacteria bacterium]